MNILLTSEMEQFIRDRVSSGRYSSASEVVLDALRLLEERDFLRERRLQELRREIAIGLEAADRGELLDGEQVMADLRKRHEERMNAEAEVTGQTKHQE